MSLCSELFKKTFDVCRTEESKPIATAPAEPRLTSAVRRDATNK